MELQIVKDNQSQVAWERDPVQYAEGVTLSHRLHYRRLNPMHRVEQYTGTAMALVNAGVCAEEQLPPERSVMRTYAPDGKRKKTRHPMEAGALKIVRTGRRLFRCDRFFALTNQEQDHIKAQEEKDRQERLQREQERDSRNATSTAERKQTYFELMVRVFEEKSNEHIDRIVQSTRESFLDTEKAMLYVKEQRRKVIAESDGVVIYPKVWKHL